MKDAGQSHDKRFRIVVSFLREGFRKGGKHAADVVADSPAGRRSFDENDGEGHSRRVLQLSCLPVCSQENLCGETDENSVAAKCGLESLLFFFDILGSHPCFFGVALFQLCKKRLK